MATHKKQRERAYEATHGELRIVRQLVPTLERASIGTVLGLCEVTGARERRARDVSDLTEIGDIVTVIDCDINVQLDRNVDIERDVVRSSGHLVICVRGRADLEIYKPVHSRERRLGC